MLAIQARKPHNTLFLRTLYCYFLFDTMRTTTATSAFASTATLVCAKSPVVRVYFLAASICALFAFSEYAEAQIPFSLPRTGRPRTGRDSSQVPKKQYRTAEDVLNTPQDTTEFDPEKPLENEFLRHSSRGWFPIPFSAHSIFFWSDIAFPLNFGSDIRFSTLPTTTHPYSFTNPYTENEQRRPFRVGSKTEREAEFPEDYLRDAGLMYELSLPIPIMFRFGAHYVWQGTSLFSNNTAGRFLPNNAAETPVPVQLVNNLFVEEQRLEGLAGIKIPIYGVFADFVDQRLASYYYLSVAALGSYTTWHNALQYAQILAPNNDVRFTSRSDTTRRWNAPLPNFNERRINIDVAVGWGVSGDFSVLNIQAGFAFLAEVYCTIPTQPLVQNIEWRQYAAGVRINFGWHNRLGK
ncbi:MAG: hypothetical protein EAZ92_02770 [Candidatus Kapaibacterium sp.]|nr:MAG: hypothetical protein EAZ92_02770 [Candidatus Kapabacteria bacterium]